MEGWKTWTVFFLGVSTVTFVLIYAGLVEALAIALSLSFSLAIVCVLLGHLRKRRHYRHLEHMAMIEKGMAIENRSQDSGVPSLAIVLLIGVGLAAVIISDAEFVGYVLLFVGIGLIIRTFLIQRGKNEQAQGTQSKSGNSANHADSCANQ